MVFVDAAFEPNGSSGIGGLLFDGDRQLLRWFGFKVTDRIVKILQRRFEWSRETVIYELEALAVVVALNVFDSHLRRRNVVIFTDNEGVHGSFVTCWSENPVGNALALRAARCEFDLHAFFYYDRVPSASNPADAPSSVSAQVVCFQVVTVEGGPSHGRRARSP